MAALLKAGITPDFYIDARSHFEKALAEKLHGQDLAEFVQMPAQPDKIATPEVLQQFDAILSLNLKLGAASLEGVQRLALVSRWGVGYDMIDVPALTEAGVALSITPDAVRRPVAEAILTLMFALAKNVREQDKVIRNGGWRGDLSRLGITFAGRVLGSVGCGNIAQELFRISSSLGFGRFLAADPYVRPSDVHPLGVELVSLDEVLSTSDFVAVNTPLNDSTRGMIGAAELLLMKPGAFLINTARGSVIQEQALIDALQRGQIAGAGLDVFDREPVAPDNPLLQMDNVILAPHGLAWTEELTRDNTYEACEHILQLARGEVPSGVVNREVLDRPAFRRKLQRFGQHGF